MDTFVRNSYIGSFSGNDIYWEKPFLIMRCKEWGDL